MRFFCGRLGDQLRLSPPGRAARRRSSCEPRRLCRPGSGGIPAAPPGPSASALFTQRPSLDYFPASSGLPFGLYVHQVVSRGMFLFKEKREGNRGARARRGCRGGRPRTTRRCWPCAQGAAAAPAPPCGLSPRTADLPRQGNELQIAVGTLMIQSLHCGPQPAVKKKN